MLPSTVDLFIWVCCEHKNIDEMMKWARNKISPAHPKSLNSRNKAFINLRELQDILWSAKLWISLREVCNESETIWGGHVPTDLLWCMSSSVDFVLKSLSLDLSSSGFGEVWLLGSIFGCRCVTCPGIIEGLSIGGISPLKKLLMLTGMRGGGVGLIPPARGQNGSIPGGGWGNLGRPLRINQSGINR